MHIRQYFNFFFLFVLLPFSSIAIDFSGPHRLTLGPEFYHIKRTREGGSVQTGYLAGVHLQYDRVSPSNLFWAAEFYYARGTIRGKSGGGLPLKSRKSDLDVEARIGYTFSVNRFLCTTFTPFLGGGYFEGVNKFMSPSPVPVKLTNCFPHITAGVLVLYNRSSGYFCGVQFQAKYPVDAKCKVNNDPEFEDTVMKIEEEFLFELDLPFGIRKCFGNRLIDVTLVPFYRYRKYGRHENFPFDYYETRFQIYGGRLTLSIAF